MTPLFLPGYMCCVYNDGHLQKKGLIQIDFDGLGREILYSSCIEADLIRTSDRIGLVSVDVFGLTEDKAMIRLYDRKENKSIKLSVPRANIFGPFSPS